MSFVNMFTDLAGDAGNSTAVAYPGGPGVFVITGDDFTGVTMKHQWADFDAPTTFYQVGADVTSITSGKTVVVSLPPGMVRFNITGGGAGDNIDAKYCAGGIGNPQSIKHGGTTVTNS